ncbi:DUF4189 domain-containing protein [Burkholderia anthina]|uniref:DUF4189 domain-containing protein n=1 Tax=Burkholderia stagnalis TaxID=1503054 RepID=UPI000F8144C4
MNTAPKRFATVASTLSTFLVIGLVAATISNADATCVAGKPDCVIGDPNGVVVPPTVPFNPTPPAKFGAIAADVQTGKSAWSKNYSSQSDAQRYAMESCGNTCQIFVNLRDNCGAVASDGGQHWRGSTGLTKHEAEERAVAICRKTAPENSPNCQIRESICSNG